MRFIKVFDEWVMWPRNWFTLKKKPLLRQFLYKYDDICNDFHFIHERLEYNYQIVRWTKYRITIRIFFFSISDNVYCKERATAEKSDQDTKVIDVCETCQVDVEEPDNSEPDKIQGMFPRHPWNWLIDNKNECYTIV